jgi:hypothetical protein
VPSGRVSGAAGTLATGVGGGGGATFFRDVRFGFSAVAVPVFFARGFRRVAGVVTSDPPSSPATGAWPFSLPFSRPLSAAGRASSARDAGALTASCNTSDWEEGTRSMDYERRRFTD